MESKYLIVAVILGCALESQAAPDRTVNFRQSRQIAAQAQTQIRQNLVTSLASLSNVTSHASTNITRAANTLMNGIVTNSVSLASVFAYLPRLILLDGPTQFVETLRLIRSNQLRFPTDIDTAIDTLIAYANQQRDSGIGKNFEPLTTFLPNMFTGFEKYLTTFIDSVFNVIGN